MMTDKNTEDNVIAGICLIAAIGYVGMILFTFGHSASHCTMNAWDINRTEVKCDNFLAFMKAGVAAPFWPLYWSWELQK